MPLDHEIHDGDQKDYKIRDHKQILKKQIDSASPPVPRCSGPAGESGTAATELLDCSAFAACTFCHKSFVPRSLPDKIDDTYVA